jgi:5-methylcytosine-specific restriction protein B
VTENAEQVFETKGPDAKADGIAMENGFQVRAGGVARKAVVASAGNSVQNTQRRLLAEGVLDDKGKSLVFLQDYTFDTPSGAAAAVLGRTANGWIEWKLPDGRTLSDVKRVSRDERVPILSEAQRKAIIDRYQTLLSEGSIPSPQQLEKQYAAFTERFGPSVLAGLDGEALLSTMHDHGNHDSLVYWIEFKNDDEFATKRFGSIAGGSALKFRIFRRKETGNWQKGSEQGNKPEDISVAEAIEIARSHRDQLLRGVKLLEDLPANASDEQYAELQDQLDEQAPDVSRLAWGHKYFSLLFPDKLDDYHSPEWQRYILLKLLQLPPDGDGRYVCAGRFIAAARETGIRVVSLDSVLNTLFGTMHRYWRIGTTNETDDFWPMMRDNGCVAIGWPKLGDISWLEASAVSREKLRKKLSKVHPNAATTIGRDCSQITQFVLQLKEGSIVVAANGMTILGVGRVVGQYEFHSDSDFPHQRKVEWLDISEWKMPEPKEGLRSTVRELRKFNENILAIEQRIQSAKDIPIPPVKVAGQKRLTGIPGRIQSVLERKGQVILYGPPGTGKTYWAENAAKDLAALMAFGLDFDSLEESQQQEIIGHDEAAGLVRICCFHPAYGYEDFLEGYRPQTVSGQLSFQLRDGVFKKLCSDAKAKPERNFYLIVDEINRGDIPRIFGELLTTLEKDKRGKRIILPVSQELFTIPSNVFLIGTMNTADRSISLLDAALRRRFGFVEMMPDGGVLKDSLVGGIALRAWFEALNAKIREHAGRDARNLQIGHSYLLHSGSPLKDVASLKRAIRDDIIPLLEEYCYEDFGSLGQILGDQVVDVQQQRIRHELFDDGQEDALVQALLAPFADIARSTEALSSVDVSGDVDDDEEEDSES